MLLGKSIGLVRPRRLVTACWVSRNNGRVTAAGKARIKMSVFRQLNNPAGDFVIVSRSDLGRLVADLDLDPGVPVSEREVQRLLDWRFALASLLAGSR